jgi:hypothetical protein
MKSVLAVVQKDQPLISCGSKPTHGERVMQQSSRLIISSCIGGILGVLLVRALFLDGIEEIGWRIFWEGLGNGRMMNFGAVVQSSTFAKCLAGLVIGGTGAMICAWRWGGLPTTQAVNKNG